MGKMKGKGNAVAIATGAVSALLLCAAGLAVLTHFVLTQKVGERGIVFAVPILLLAVTLLGGQAAARLAVKDSCLVSAIVAGTVILSLFIIGLMMDGIFQNVLTNIGAIAIGAVMSCALCLKKPKRMRYSKRANR